MGKPVRLDETWLERIADSLNGLEYGQVLIVVHDGRIVQIERTERKRFDGEATSRTVNRAKRGEARPPAADAGEASQASQPAPANGWTAKAGLS